MGGKIYVQVGGSTATNSREGGTNYFLFMKSVPLVMQMHGENFSKKDKASFSY